MRTTEKTLPLFNEIYQLGFEENVITNYIEQTKELRKLIKDKKDLKDYLRSFDFYLTLSNKQYKIEYVPSSVYYLYGRYQDEDYNITKRKSTDLPHFKNKYEIYYQGNIDSTVFVSTKTFSLDKLKNLDHILNYWDEYNSNGIDPVLRSQKTIASGICDLDTIINVLSEEKFIHKYITKSVVNTRQDVSLYNASYEEQVKFCNWLMPNAAHTSEKDLANIRKTIKSLTTNSSNIGIITDVFENNNKRLGLLEIHGKSYSSHEHFYRVVLLEHKHGLYDYLDAGRLFLLSSSLANTYAYGHMNDRYEDYLLGNILFTEDIELPSKEVIQYLCGQRTDETLLYDEETFKLEAKKYIEKVRRDKKHEDQTKKIQNKLKTKLDTLKTDNDKILLNDITIYKNKIEYEGQVLAFDKNNTFIKSMVTRMSRVHKPEEINWDMLFDDFIYEASNNECSGQLGDVNFNVEYEKRTNKLDITSVTKYINNIRINKNEIQQCLRRAICYETQEDYDNFLSNVSSCSLKFHRYLQVGLDFSIPNGLDGTYLHFKLPLERKKNIMYVVLGDKEYRVSDTNKLINLTSSRNLSTVMETLIEGKVIQGMELQSIKSIIKLAKTEYSQALKKSEDLLKETEKTLNLKKQHNISMGNKINVPEGYIVTGKLRKYVVANNDKCEVYEYPTGRYICIVDKSTSQVGKDKLINRLYALSNDSALAKSIHTLN